MSPLKLSRPIDHLCFIQRLLKVWSVFLNKTSKVKSRHINQWLQALSPTSYVIEISFSGTQNYSIRCRIGAAEGSYYRPEIYWWNDGLNGREFESMVRSLLKRTWVIQAEIKRNTTGMTGLYTHWKKYNSFGKRFAELLLNGRKCIFLERGLHSYYLIAEF